MTDFMLDIYIRNQLYINPMYDGELLTINGVTYDTSERTCEIVKDFKIDTSSRSLEMYIAYICNEDSIAFMMKDKAITLSQLIKVFKKELPVKRHAEKTLEILFPIVAPVLSKNICKGPYEIVGNSLIIPKTSKANMEKAFRHLFGLEDTRFMYNTSKTIFNGNMLDLHQETLKKFSSLKGSFSSYANLIRAMGYPYSDYRRYVSLGILVSIDIFDNVFIIKDDMLHCTSISKFQRFLDKEENILTNGFTTEFDFSNAAVDTKFRLNKDTLKKIVEVLLQNESD